MRAALVAFALLVAAPIGACHAQPNTARAASDGDPVINFADDDAGMNSAVAEARRTLPFFWETQARFRENSEAFAVKVGFPTPHQTNEHIWVASPVRTGARLQGLLANAPVDLPDMAVGQRVEFGEDQISDWSVEVEGKLYGAYTVRYMLEATDVPDEEQVRAALHPTPLP